MNKNTFRKIKSKQKKINASFSGKTLTLYSGISPIMSHLWKIKLPQKFDTLFPSINHAATTFSNTQILLACLLSALCSVAHLNQISNFTKDKLVSHLLNLKRFIKPQRISERLKTLGVAGSHTLNDLLLKYSRDEVLKSNQKDLVLDCDSTSYIVYGKQEGAAKGYNTTKKGAYGYHPLLAFNSGLKTIFNTWFRTGSAYTANGICEFLKQTAEFIPDCVETVFFRADSGFFSGKLFDLLEERQWDYLVKVKFKGMKKVLTMLDWIPVKADSKSSIAEFKYKAKGWEKERVIKCVRTLKNTEKIYLFDSQLKIMHVVCNYEYACYCSGYDLDGYELHELYCQRSTSETWIEQIKSQLKAGVTRTNSFAANDILWSLSSLAYNISVIIRKPIEHEWRTEHKTFLSWFIVVPGKVTRGQRGHHLQLYKHYYEKKRWQELETAIVA